jgi:putative polyhydroxyalkanoate system protein
MATIRIDRPHRLSHADARTLVERVARDFEKRFDLAWRWEGDEVHFARPGVSGFMLVGASTLVLEVRLGLLLSPLKPTIERQMNAHLDALEGGPTSA